jgi:HSP20 family protein
MSILQRPRNRFSTSNPWLGLASELHRERNREMNPAYRARGAVFQGSRGVFPPVNLQESKDGYLLSAELPGVSSENIDVQIEGSTVTLSGQRKPGGTPGDGVSVHRRERQFGNFRRAFDLPSEIDLDRARATHKNGVLTLQLPKSPAVQPRQIEVETR